MSGKFFFSTVSLELYCSAAILWDQLCICGRNAVRFRAVVASGASWRAFLVASSAAAPSSLGVGHDEAPEREQILRMALHLGNHTACRLSIGYPMEEALESHDRLMSREAHSRAATLNIPHQVVVGRNPNRVLHPRSPSAPCRFGFAKAASARNRTSFPLLFDL
jgi:hypothetical protein